MNLKKSKNKETDEILYVSTSSPSKFIEGDEYLPVYKNEFGKGILLYIKKKSLIFMWKGM